MNKYPFNKAEELKNAGAYPRMPGPYGRERPEGRKFNTPVTPKENMLRLFEKKEPLWIPNSSVDANIIQPAIMPDAAARIFGGTDWFGIHWRYDEITKAGMVEPGTRALSSITAWESEIKWPDLEEIDWQKDYVENFKELLDPDRATLFIIVNGFFERLADLTSFEDALCALIEEPDAVCAFFNRLCDWHIELMSIARNVYKADIITFHDDMGTQKNSFISPKMFRNVFMPHYQRMNKAAHEMGLYVNLHSCGYVENQIENFIESDFDMWEGQYNANDIPSLAEKYKGRLLFHNLIEIPNEASEAEAIEMAINRVYGSGKTGALVLWERELEPTRNPKIAETIYSESRKLFCGEAEQ